MGRAQSDDPAPNSRRIRTGTQGSHHGCHGLYQPASSVSTWSYKLDKAALYDSKFKNAEVDNVSHRSKC
jgi:hypothetical protein